MKKSILTLISMLFVVGCAKPNSAWRMNPRPQTQILSEEGGPAEIEFAPKAEIVFVIDNSKSMDKHNKNFRANIAQFVDAFSRNNPTQYNLAVTTVYDSRWFNTKEYQEKWGGTDAYFEPGQFRPVKSSATDVVPKYFISSGDKDLKSLLKNTLNVGIQDLDQGGPWYEEVFTPIGAIYGFGPVASSKKVREQQKGFFMGSDSFKVVFFVTDASDSSNMTASDLYKNLVYQTGDHSFSDENRSKVLAFAAIVPSDSNNCTRDPGGNKPYKIEEFLSSAKQVYEDSNVVSLCSTTFGHDLGVLGKSIRQRTLTQSFVVPNGIPVFSDDPTKTLRVFYGNQEIPWEGQPGAVVGYTYDPSTNSVVMNPDFEFLIQPGAKIRFEGQQVSPQDVRNGRVTPYGATP